MNEEEMTKQEEPLKQDETIQPAEQEQPAPTPMQPAPATDDAEDDIATAEEMAAEVRRQAERRAQRKGGSKIVDNEEQENPLESGARPEDLTDPYAEPDPAIPWATYKENLFVSRGCHKCPTSYVPVNMWEMGSCSKVSSFNWMHDIHQPVDSEFNVVEVRFKNNRKDYYRLPDGLSVVEGDVVAVEGQPGHDIGIVTLTGEACRMQMKNKKVDPNAETIKKLFRRAKAQDIEKWVESIKDEPSAVLKTRSIAERLGLDMKVNDVEIQGDHGKAIFYYTADDRVDFRVLIKVLAEEFRVRVEMKQIGVRQEAAKVGGLGTCGRELCCCTWLTNFKTVTTGAAKVQQILPNPQKLAGQCGKLKCCLNFEYEVYADALKKFPQANVPMRFKKGLALYKKTDVFRGVMWYAYEGENDLYAIPAESVKKIIEMNRNQEYPERLEDFQVELMSTSALAQETTSAEFERELRRMAEGGNGVVEEEKKPSDNRRPARDASRGASRGDNSQHRDRCNEGDRREAPRNERRDNGRHDRRETPRNERREGQRNDRREAPRNERRDNGRSKNNGEQRPQNTPKNEK